MSKYGINKTPKEIMLSLAENVLAIRKEKKISREELSEFSGVSYSSLRRFENTGMISFESLLKISSALGRLSEFENLLQFKNTEQKKNLFDI